MYTFVMINREGLATHSSRSRIDGLHEGIVGPLQPPIPFLEFAESNFINVQNRPV